MSRIVVYAVIMGNYELLRPTRFPSICLTDSTLESVEGWTIRKISKKHSDPRRASRYPKMMPHKYFPDAKYTIYLDGNIGLLRSPEKIVRELLRRDKMALFSHPERSCTYEEALKCIAYKKADPAIVEKQMEHYREVGFPSEYGLTACWVIIRRNTSEVQQFGEAWWKEYLRFSRRDQLSFDFVRWRTGMKYRRIPGNLFRGNSKYFRRWKHIRRPEK